MRLLTATSLVFLLYLTAAAQGPTPPEIAFVYPPGGAAGSTIEVRVGGYNWTPDMQIFVHDPRVTLELTGGPGPVIVPEPPYWFGKKARGNDFPLPREFPAKLTIAAGTPPGLVRWQAANANGATASGVLLVTAVADVAEQRLRAEPQKLAAIPTTIVGRLLKLEEVDRYSFTSPRTGPVTLDVWTRRLKTQMNAILEVRDASGRLVADGADTAGHDLQLTFAAAQGAEYTVSLYDADFRGHHSFVYRLVVHDGPRALAAYPSAGKRGETRPVEFVGYGLATGAPQLESLVRDVAFPPDAAAKSFSHQLATPLGASLPFTLGLSDQAETVEPAAASEPPKLTLPAAVTGAIEQRNGEDRYLIEGKKGDLWSIACACATAGLPLDLAVTVRDATGKELMRVDDVPGTTDASLTVSLPADGAYQVAVSDASGLSGSRAAAYRLSIASEQPGFTLTAPELLAVPLGGKLTLPVKVSRQAGHKEPIQLSLTGLPEGITLAGEAIIPGDKSELAVPLACAADVAAKAGVVTVQATAPVNGQPLARTTPSLFAITMKPRVKLTPEGLDDVRKWPRGTTYPAPVLIERLEGFTGEVILEQTAQQQRVRQGITGPDFKVPAGATRVEYPVFLPEWLETTKTSRIILNGVVQVPDPKGNVRHLVSKMELRIGMLPVGALLKLSHTANELTVPVGQPFEIPLTLTRAAELTGPVTLELHLPEDLAGQLTAEPVTLASKENLARLRVVPAAGAALLGEREITIRAKSLYQGHWPVLSETTLTVEFAK